MDTEWSAFAPKCPNAISRLNYKIPNKRLFSCAKKKTSAERVIMKCRKVLWLEARVALWSSCKPTQSGESRFSLCKKIYEWTAAALIAQQLCGNSLMEDERMKKGKGRRTVRWKKLVIGY